MYVLFKFDASDQQMHSLHVCSLDVCRYIKYLQSSIHHSENIHTSANYAYMYDDKNTVDSHCHQNTLQMSLELLMTSKAMKTHTSLLG